MIKSSFLYLSILAGLFLHSCENDEPKPSGCCDNPAISEAVGPGHIYIPNIFTPDGDGINDYLNVFGDNNIKVVRSLTISDRDSKIVFYSPNSQPNLPEAGWNGWIKSKKAIKGLYRVTAEVEAIDGTVLRVSGLVCNFSCDEDAKENDPLETSNCRFPSNADYGHFNLNLPSGESDDCFE
jgi:hypothetical protein